MPKAKKDKPKPRCLLCLGEVQPIKQKLYSSAVFTCDTEFLHTLWPYRDDDYIDGTPPCEEEYHHQSDSLIVEESTETSMYTVARSAAGVRLYDLIQKRAVSRTLRTLLR